MQTLKKSADGKVIMVQRAAGIAVSAMETEWNARGRVMVSDWKLKATGLNLQEAEELFSLLAA